MSPSVLSLSAMSSRPNGSGSNDSRPNGVTNCRDYADENTLYYLGIEALRAI
jgi:hypothetical protein